MAPQVSETELLQRELLAKDALLQSKDALLATLQAKDEQLLATMQAKDEQLLQSKDALLATMQAKGEQLLQSKDALLATMQAQNEQLLQSKDVMLSTMQAQNEQLLQAVKDAAAAQKLALRVDLRRAAEEATRTVEGVKLRSVVEYLAKTHGSQSGAQKGLDALFKDDEQLRSLLVAFSQHFKLLPVDLERCASGLYHTLSKELHGSEARCEVHEAHWRSPAERAALCALLERFAVAYTYVVDEAVVPSPYAEVALAVLGLK